MKTVRSSIAASRRFPRIHMSTGRTALVAVLVMRALANASFATWLQIVVPDRSRFFDGAAMYLATDGILALLIAVILGFDVAGEAPRLLTGATAMDGLVRTAAAVVLLALPGWSDFPVSSVAFFGIFGAYAGCLAVAALIIRIRVWQQRHHVHQRTPVALHEELDPVFVTGVIALCLAGYMMLVGPPVAIADYRALGAVWTFALAVAFLIAAFGVRSVARRNPIFGLSVG